MSRLEAGGPAARQLWWETVVPGAVSGLWWCKAENCPAGSRHCPNRLSGVQESMVNIRPVAVEIKVKN